MLIRGVWIAGAIGAFLFCAVGQAQPPRHRPVVVAEIPGAISATLFYRRIQRDQVLPNEGQAGLILPLRLEDRLPLVAARLRIAAPSRVEVDGLVTPLFVMGLDPASLRWFEDVVEDLARRAARGVVVSAPNSAVWEQFRQAAGSYGIHVQLMKDEVIAEGYGLATYPALLVGATHVASEDRQ